MYDAPPTIRLHRRANKVKQILSLILAICIISPVQAGERQTLTPIKDKPLAPDFSLKDVDGNIHRLSDQKGKLVMVNFWATWCPPCREEMPSMQRLWENFKGKDFVLYAVNIAEDEDTIFAFSFATGVELQFPILMDQKGTIIQQWQVLGLPTTFIIDPQGHVIYRAVGARTWDHPDIAKQINGLLPISAKKTKNR